MVGGYYWWAETPRLGIFQGQRPLVSSPGAWPKFRLKSWTNFTFLFISRLFEELERSYCAFWNQRIIPLQIGLLVAKNPNLTFWPEFSFK